MHLIIIHVHTLVGLLNLVCNSFAKEQRTINDVTNHVFQSITKPLGESTLISKLVESSCKSNRHFFFCRTGLEQV